MLEISIQVSAIQRFEESKNKAELRNNGLLLQMTIRGMVLENRHEGGRNSGRAGDKKISATSVAEPNGCRQPDYLPGV